MAFGYAEMEGLLCIGRINEIVKDVRKAWIVFLLFEVGQHEMPCI
jgi:hypothetical protein